MNIEEVLKATENANALLTEKDKQALFTYAQKVKVYGTIVDIGTGGGGSSFIMALASNPSVRVWTIDPIQNQGFIEKRKALNLEEKIVFVNKKSSDAWKTFGQDTIDMLFIDGVHSYNGVKDDFETFGSKVKEGGIIAFHDVDLYDNTIGAYVQEIVDKKLITPVETVHSQWIDGRNIGLFIGRK